MNKPLSEKGIKKGRGNFNLLKIEEFNFKGKDIKQALKDFKEELLDWWPKEDLEDLTSVYIMLKKHFGSLADE